MGCEKKILYSLTGKRRQIQYAERWIPKDINTQSEYVILIASPLQQWLHVHPPMLSYKYNACLV
jgi:hypothetical protein